MFTLAQIVNLELIQKSDPGWFTPGNIISILVAIIAASAVIYNARNTTKTLRENNKDSINANLTASARIEWIQTVRVLVAELIVILEKLNHDYKFTIKEIKGFVYDAKNKISLIQLYLGPDTIKSNNKNPKSCIDTIKSCIKTSRSSQETNKSENNTSEVDIYNIMNNNGKNEWINKKLDELNSKLDAIISEIHSADLYDTEHYNIDRFFTEKVNDNLPESAETLKKIFRIYFKVEWRKAKKGK